MDTSIPVGRYIYDTTVEQITFKDSMLHLVRV